MKAMFQKEYRNVFGVCFIISEVEETLLRLSKLDGFEVMFSIKWFNHGCAFIIFEGKPIILIK